MIKATVNQSIYEVKEGTTLSDLAKQVQAVPIIQISAQHIHTNSV